MMIRATNKEFVLFRDFIHDECGIYLADTKKYLVETRLSAIVSEAGCYSFNDFYKLLENPSVARPLKAKVIDAMTTNETLWFRDTKPFRVLSDSLFTTLSGEIKAGSRSKIDIWSAVCSTGQEPYSIAISALESNLSKSNVKILASDISPSALSIAKLGEYDSLAVSRGLSTDFQAKFFAKQGEKWSVNDNVKSMIDFKEFNLKDPPIGIIGPFDIIFLRNVIIYFSTDFKKTLFERIKKLLKPNGCLFLGTGETITSFSSDFEAITEHGATYYRLK